MSGRGGQRLPEQLARVGADPGHVDQPRSLSRAIADDAAWLACRIEVDSDRDDLAAAGGATLAEAQLRQARAGRRDHRERARHHLRVELALVARGDLVEGRAAVDDDAYEDVQPARRALGVGPRGDARRQREALHQRDDVHAIALEHGRPGEVDLVRREIGQPVGDAAAGAGQKARRQPVGFRAESQVEARRLHLIGIERALCRDDAVGERRGDALRGPDQGHATKLIRAACHVCRTGARTRPSM